MDIHLLGPVEVRHEGTPVPLGGPKPASVFALLSVHRNQVVGIERIADSCWHGCAPSAVKSQIQVYVSQLRRALRQAGADDDRIETRRMGYVMRAGPGELDLGRFENLTRRARGAFTDGQLATGSALLREALELWRGSALEDIRAPFAEAEAARWEALRLGALTTRLIVDLALGRSAEVAAESQALVRSYPLHEGLWARLMMALHLDGRSAEALDTYRRARAVLQKQVGMEPGPELRQVADAVRRGETGQRQVDAWAARSFAMA